MGGGGLYVLFEHAAGYALFRVKEFEEIGMLLPQVENSVKDLGKFSSVVNFIAFQPFKTGQNALENMNAISEGVLHEDLELFLETNLPKKKKNVTMGVADSKLGAAVGEKFSVSVLHTGAVPEIIRGIRVHFSKMISGFSAATQSKSQLGLGHSYSRAKVKFNVHRSDNMIIQSIALLDQLDKDINTFSMRIREWYSYHFPELYKIVPDNYMYAKLTQCIKNRKEMTDETLATIEELVMDSGKAKAILDASKSSMGMDISPLDLINIEMFAKRVVALSEYRLALQEYLKSKMTNVAPNLATLIGETVGARLISQAGSLTNLAKYPASTLQILGAEKALFRALKTRGNTPKYGLLFHSTFIGRAATQNKGRMSRFLANKCAMASRIDCFAENPTSVFGTNFREQVEERLKFYETGETPRKNVDVMAQAMEEFEFARAKLVASEKKKKKKKRKHSELEESMTADDTMEANGDVEMGKICTKKSMSIDDTIDIEIDKTWTKESVTADSTIEANDEVPKKKKKKKKSKVAEEAE